VPGKPCLRGRRDENQRLAVVPAISIPPKRDAVQSAGADCGDLRWATVGLDFSGERSEVASEGGRWSPREATGCQPGLTIAELRNGHISSGRRDRSPSLPGRAWETALEPGLKRGCRSTRRPELPESTLGVTRRHADQGCVVGARRRSPRRRSHRRDWQPAKRAREPAPKGKIAPFHRRRTNR